MSREQALRLVEKALRKTFEVFRLQGAVSFYVWGSLTREDYDPAISDVDLIFVLDDAADPDLQVAIKARLAALLPGFREIGGQGLMLSELDGGEARTFFAKLHPLKVRSALSSFEDWRYVCGRIFRREDFKAADLSIDEEIGKAREEALKVIAHLGDESRNWRKDLLKLGLKLAYLRAVKAQGRFALSYDTLAGQALAGDQETAALLARLREAADYRPESFDASIPLIKEWVAMTATGP